MQRTSLNRYSWCIILAVQLILITTGNGSAIGKWAAFPRGVLANPSELYDVINKHAAITPSSSTSKNQAETVVQDFLSTSSETESKFYIQGWRWHTLALIRDSDRLHKYAQHVLDDTSSSTPSPTPIPMKEKLESFNKAVNHVIGFNFKGLQHVENEVFFPWLRKKLINEDVGQDAKVAFQEVIDNVDQDRKKVDNIALDIKSQINVVMDPQSDTLTVRTATENISQMSHSLSSITQSILEREDRLLVPAVAKLVSASEQRSFNNKVLRNLGLFDSRCHLVGMHDAVHDKAYAHENEKVLFEEHIPSIAKMMINRWRRTLYEPRAGMLNEF